MLLCSNLEEIKISLIIFEMVFSSGTHFVLSSVYSPINESVAELLNECTNAQTNSHHVLCHVYVCMYFLKYCLATQRINILWQIRVLTFNWIMCFEFVICNAPATNRPLTTFCYFAPLPWKLYFLAIPKIQKVPSTQSAHLLEYLKVSLCIPAVTH